MPKTIGESTILDSDITAKSGFVKIHWKNVVFLAAANRPVRESISSVNPAEQSKIEEIGLTSEL